MTISDDSEYLLSTALVSTRVGHPRTWARLIRDRIAEDFPENMGPIISSRDISK